MVHVNDVSVRETKLARDTHRYIYFQRKTPPVRHIASYCGLQEIISSCDHDMTIGGVTHKN